MADLETFCKLAVTSRLIGEAELSAERAKCLGDSAADFADHLIARELLTP